MQASNNKDLFDFYTTSRPPIGFLSIPHSGMWVPDEFKEFLVSDTRVQNQDVDFAVDQLVDIQKLNDAGIVVLVSRVHRVCVDLNREEKICVLNWQKNSHGHNLVVKGPDQQTIKYLTQKYYDPYYMMIKSTIENLHLTHKKVSVIDLHSMPSKPTKYHLDINPNQRMQRPDFCVSDISGLSCEKEFIDLTCQKLMEFTKGDVTQNDPYFGGHVTRHINAKFDYTNNIQIEINRSLYMDEENISLIDKHISLKENLTQSLIEVFSHFNS